MSDLYHRVLLWHKLICSTTGGLALCSAKHRLNRDEAQGWAGTLRNVADEIEAVLAGQPFILDDKGRRVVQSASEGPTTRYFDKGGTHVATTDPLGPARAQRAGPRGTLKVATRKKNA